MTATTAPLTCTTPNCSNLATGTLPVYIPSDVSDHVCTECLAAYWACFEEDRDDYS